MVSHVACGSLRSYSFAEQTEDPDKVISDQLARIDPITSSCTKEQAISWMAKVDDVMSRLGKGAFAGMPSTTESTLQTLDSAIICTDKMKDKDVAVKVLGMLPSLWKTAYWYASTDEFGRAFAPVFAKSVAAAKAEGCDAQFDAAVNATSLIIRFTKDNVFTEGVDDGKGPTMRGEYLEILAGFVSQVSKTNNYKVNEEQLRCYMNTLHSKKDGMDMSKPYPVYVDTAKFAGEDLTALKKYLSKCPSEVGATLN
ncbi:TPA: hypothetical protein N0F65_010104 [Lagenidium giganteum]|uniref:Uncharacterized protein n=1 Tax=Lagenidium giganteum TaxID=4803 RepID=A0AAV2YBF6_9STRA|nr:TPA: hypothetical protein N0F65_009629 [Lagenidium giganteum]DAZ93088.1 TPA: hypothetical protein N0F65_010104 [Lagenidium giganteum]